MFIHSKKITNVSKITNKTRMSIPIDETLSHINWEALLLNSPIQVGGSLVGYSGLKYQRGHGIGSFFRSLFRIAAPITKKIFKKVGKEGARAGLEIGSDLIEGRNLKESVQEHSKESGRRLLRKGLKRLEKSQKGGRNIGVAQRNRIKRSLIGYRKRDLKKKSAKANKLLQRKILFKKSDFLGSY